MALALHPCSVFGKDTKFLIASYAAVQQAQAITNERQSTIVVLPHTYLNSASGLPRLATWFCGCGAVAALVFPQFRTVTLFRPFLSSAPSSWSSLYSLVQSNSTYILVHWSPHLPRGPAVWGTVGLKAINGPDDFACLVKYLANPKTFRRPTYQCMRVLICSRRQPWPCHFSSVWP